MNDMRKLINLMEGVMAVPGLNEARFPNVSCSQCGRDFGPGDSGYSHCSDHKGKTPVDESHVSDGQMSNPAPAVDVLAMEDANDIESSMHPVNMIRSIITQLHPNDTSMDAIAREVPPLARDPQFSEWYQQAYNSYYGVSDNSESDEDDFTDYTMRQGETGNPDRAMEEDLNNGYDSVETATGSDFFPNGADSPVVKAAGPSGARQGDNPEQKKMQVAEVHKELVYGYRNFLKEENLTELKKSTLRSYAKKSSKDADKHMWSGDEKAKSGDTDGALKDFDKTAKRNKGEIRALQKAGDIKESTRKNS